MNKDTFHNRLDNILEQKVDSILSLQKAKMDNLLEHIGASFVLFGAGRLGKITLAGLRKAGIEPLAFADNAPKLWGQEIEGVRVLSPQDAKNQFEGKAVFVITVYTSTPIRNQLRELGIHFISFAELAWYYPNALLPHYGTDLPHAIFEQADKVQKALDIWTDDISRYEYIAQLSWRTSLDPDVLSSPLKPQEMYFPTELFSFLPNDTLVDCGAFDGDTIRELERRGINYHRLIAIEPDPINFAKLEKYVSTLNTDLRNRITLCQNAIGAIREQVTFDATGTASTIIGPGSYSVESIPLDSLLMKEQPTYIKMDIEGAEYQAIVGSEQIIKNDQPILAICLYHRQEDLWRIPLLIHSISNNYNLYLRRYSDECWEQVCYAIPKERSIS